MEERYLSVMIHSLEKKLGVLEQIIEKNEEQADCFKRDDRESEALIDKSITAKGELIDELLKLDEGFSSLYEAVKEELKANPGGYASEIGKMQELIRKITEKSVKVQTQEQQNRLLATQYFRMAHKRVNSTRATHSAADLYRKNMKRIAVVGPQFMDRKK